MASNYELSRERILESASTNIAILERAPFDESGLPESNIQYLVDTTNCRRFLLDKRRATIGSDKANDIVVSNDHFIAPFQAVITWDAQEYWLEDMISINPTKLNNVQVYKKSRLKLRDLIKVGKTKLRVE